MSEVTSFDQLDLDSRLLRAVAKLGWRNPTLIQSTAIPLAILGKSIVARAKTGTGKTAAYCLPVLNKLLKAELSQHSIRALILVPSKELAAQITSFIKESTFYCAKNITAFNACEASSFLHSETPDVIISTPTKFIELANSQNLDITSLESLVIDEADLILSFGYEDDVKKIQEMLPKVYQSFLYSATLSCDVEKLKAIFVRNAAIIKIQDQDEQDLLTQYSIRFAIANSRCSANEKFLLTYFFLKLKVHPFGTGKTIIFVNDIDRGFRLKLFLEQFGINTCILNSELPFKSRHHIVQEFNRGLYDYLIATDAPAGTEKVGDADFGVARGIDFINVQAVINFDLAANLRGYLHRIGRTARGVGNKGFALSFIEETQVCADASKKKIKESKEETVFEKIKRKQASLSSF